ncbi:alanine:cation symporter family protein [Shigella flexneri]
MLSDEAGMGLHQTQQRQLRPGLPHPAAEGIIQMIGIFIDTLVICTASAMLILLAGNSSLHATGRYSAYPGRRCGCSGLAWVL